MKKFISFIIALSLCGSIIQTNVQYLSATSQTIYYEDIQNFSGWLCTDSITYPEFKGSMKFNGETFSSDNLSLNSSEVSFNFNGVTESIEEYGSLLYCMSYLMIASGLTNESEVIDDSGLLRTVGIDPGMLMWIIMYTYGSSDGTYNGKAWTSLATTSQQYEEFINTVVQDEQANDRLKFKEQISLKDLSTEEQYEAIQKEMIAGNYVLLKFKEPSVSAPLWVLVESLKFNDVSGEYTMGTINPTKGETYMEYNMQTLECMEVWEASSDLQTRLIWYRDYTRSESDVDNVPAYLQLINRTNPTTQEIIDSFTYVTHNDVKINSIIEADLKAMEKDLRNELSLSLEIEKCYETIEESSRAYQKYASNSTTADYAIGYLQDGYKSEHNLGLAIDLYESKKPVGSLNKDNILLDMKARISNFMQSTTYEWMIANSYKYGFILRYPEEGESRTGYSMSPFHFRYIGKEYAKKYIEFTGGVADADGTVTGMYSNTKTFEDFFDEIIYQDFKTDKLKEEIKETEYSPNYYSNNVVRLVGYLFMHPVKATARAGLCVMEMVHEATSQGGIGNLLNCNFVIKFILNTNVYTYIITICIILVALSIFYYTLLYMKGIFPVSHLLKLFSRGLVITTIPVVAVYVINHAIVEISDKGFSVISSRAIIRDIETYKTEKEKAPQQAQEDGRFAIYSDSQLIELAFNGSVYEEPKYSNIQITYRDPYKGMQNRPLSVTELYEQLSGPEFFNNKKLDSTENHLLYQSDNFVPVHYDNYKDSVFYYFYDWVIYQYLHYWNTHPTVNTEMYNTAKQFTAPKSSEMRSEYVDRIEAQWTAISANSTGNVRAMYLDSKYIYPYNSEFINDICGLSSMLRMVPDSSTEFTLPDELYLATNSLTQLNKTKSQEFKYLYGTFDQYKTSQGTEKDNSKKLINSATLSSGDGWLYYSDNKLGSDSYTSCRFSPTFLLNKYKNTYYSEWASTNKFQDIDYTTMQQSTRVPLRVYGSYARMYEDLGKIDADKLEVSLNRINEKSYKNISSTINKYSGKVTDDVLLVYIALEMTSAWNKEMSSFGTPVYPQGIVSEDLTLDRILRGVYSDDTSMTNRISFMHVLNEDYNIFIAFLVLLLDITFVLTGGARVLLLLALNVSIFISCISVLFTHKFKLNEWTIGLLTQIGAIFLVQSVFVGSLNLASNFISVNNIFSTTIATLLLIVIALLMFGVTLSCALALIKDAKNWGGVKIIDAIADCVQDIQRDLKISHSKKSLHIDEAQFAETTREALTTCELDTASYRIEDKIQRRQLKQEAKKIETKEEKGMEAD